MIARVEGTVCAFSETSVFVAVNGITYEILVSQATIERLTRNGRKGEVVEFHTHHYFEGGVGMGHLVPRLVGFLHQTDLEFFQLLITVPGLSVKKALRALVIPVKDMARAIELNDVGVLKKLPEIGAKSAQKIVMELGGKAAKFALLNEEDTAAQRQPVSDLPEFQQEAVDILIQLEYAEDEAEMLVQKVLRGRPAISSAEDLIQEIFRTQVGANYVH